MTQTNGTVTREPGRCNLDRITWLRLVHMLEFLLTTSRAPNANQRSSLSELGKYLLKKAETYGIERTDDKELRLTDAAVASILSGVALRAQPGVKLLSDMKLLLPDYYAGLGICPPERPAPTNAAEAEQEYDKLLDDANKMRRLAKRLRQQEAGRQQEGAAGS